MEKDTLFLVMMAIMSMEMVAGVTVKSKWATPVLGVLQIPRTHAPKLFLKH